MRYLDLNFGNLSKGIAFLPISIVGKKLLEFVNINAQFPTESGYNGQADGVALVSWTMLANTLMRQFDGDWLTFTILFPLPLCSLSSWYGKSTNEVLF